MNLVVSDSRRNNSQPTYGLCEKNLLLSTEDRKPIVCNMDNKSLITNVTALGIIGLGYTIPTYGYMVTTAGFFALSGAFTNWIAVHMLFERVPFLYGSGIIPLHFMEFKIAIKRLIMQQFFTEESLRRFFGTEDHELLPTEPILEGIDFDLIYAGLLDTILNSKMGSVLSMVGGAKILEPLKEPITEKLHSVVREIIESPKFRKAWVKEGLSDAVHQKIEKIVDQRLDELTPDMVKSLIQEMIKDHLGWLVIWGGVFGGLIGIILEIMNHMRRII